MQHLVTTPLDLEITVLSAESLIMPNKSKKKNTVLVSVYVDSDESTWQSTSTVDMEEGETSATWNARLKVGVPMHRVKHVTFVVRLLRKSMLTGKFKSETISIANVPLSDLVAGHVARDCERFLSYRLRDRDGEGSGIVNFSVRVRGLDQDGKGGRAKLPELGVPRWRHHQEVDGVVVGIPAAWYL